MISTIRNEMDNEGTRGGGMLNQPQFGVRIKVAGIDATGAVKIFENLQGDVLIRIMNIQDVPI